MVKRMDAAGLLIDYVPGTENTFDYLTTDSREVGPTSCFVAIRGETVDGHMFIDKTVKKEAIAIVCEAVPADSSEGGSGTAFVRVSDSRKALCELASLYHGDPGRDLTITAVTGTNGKTTVATLTRRLLELSGLQSGFIGTTLYDDGRVLHAATHTTPSPETLYGLLSEMRSNGCSACSMEISSHALDQSRIRPQDIDVGVFTNLSRDHLDYHGSKESYFDAKLSLFTGMAAGSTAVVNADDPYGQRIIEEIEGASITYGLTSKSNIRYTVTSDSISGLDLTIDGMEGHFKLAGAFNAANLAAAYGVGRALGMEAEKTFGALQEADPVEGRFELIQGSEQRTVVVDYAHTPDALENILEAIQKLKNGRSVWCVFGCGGDRDRGKRPLMGAIAERLADRVVVTSDNPRNEDPDLIMKDIREGFQSPHRADWIVDRRSAIAHAASASGWGDIILIAGKGHETVQIISADRIHFDDREEARRLF
jgi:UDP-N-acetylmuramoyl-L-alanyl-D-glutamate--2,6-diaminopimelate ligase